MNHKLEQLRKRYVSQGPAAESTQTYTLEPSSIAEEGAGKPLSDGQYARLAHSISQKPPFDAAANVQSNNVQSPVEGQQHLTDVVRAIAALFEPALRYRECVSRTVQAVQALHAELQMLSEAVDPLKKLNGGVMGILEMLRKQTSDLAMSMEAAKALRLQLLALGQAPDSVSELEDEIRELCHTLMKDKHMINEKKTDAN